MMYLYVDKHRQKPKEIIWLILELHTPINFYIGVDATCDPA